MGGYDGGGEVMMICMPGAVVITFCTLTSSASLRLAGVREVSSFDAYAAPVASAMRMVAVISTAESPSCALDPPSLSSRRREFGEAATTSRRMSTAKGLSGLIRFASLSRKAMAAGALVKGK